MNTKKLLVIGDSLSYNANDYDPTFRVNSYDCFPDMGSWSFCLRDELIKSSRGFIFGAELAASQTSFSHTVFGDRALCGLNGVQLSYQYMTDTLTLYLQKHPEGGSYRVEIDDGFASSFVNFKGEEKDYHARAIFAVTLPANSTLASHTVSLEGEGPFTLLGISCEHRETNISGRGSQTVHFFLENYEERIKKFEFDTLISVLGANDVKHTTLHKFESDYAQLIEKTLSQSKDTRIILVLPPDMSDPDDLDSDRRAYCCQKTSAPYLDILRKLADKYRLQILDTWELFENIPIPQWRYDDVHFNRFGNRLLFEKMLEIIHKE